MRQRNAVAGICVVVIAMTAAGCTPVSPPPAETEEPVVSDITWEDAKASTQAMELEIAGLIPPDVVVGVVQNPTGVLFSCTETTWTWRGATTVTVAVAVAVAVATNIEAIVKQIETHYTGSRFDLSDDTNPGGAYRIQLMSPETAENYIIAEGLEPNEVRIASTSECFSLPEGTYPGGDF